MSQSLSLLIRVLRIVVQLLLYFLCTESASIEQDGHVMDGLEAQLSSSVICSGRMKSGSPPRRQDPKISSLGFLYKSLPGALRE